MPLLGNMETLLGDRGLQDSSPSVEDFTPLVGVLSQLTRCLSLLVDVAVVVVLLQLFLHHSGIGSMVSLGILLVSAQIER